MSDIPADLLDAPVSDRDIATIAAKYLTKWEDLSPFLGLTRPQESNIRHTFQDYSDKKREALRQWKTNEGDAATYRAFITAATAASNKELVDNVKAMLRARQQPPRNGAAVAVDSRPEQQARILSELINNLLPPV